MQDDQKNVLTLKQLERMLKSARRIKQSQKLFSISLCTEGIEYQLVDPVLQKNRKVKKKIRQLTS